VRYSGRHSQTTYCVVGLPGLACALDEDRRASTTAQYIAHRTAVDCMGHMLDWSVQETDHALWEGGRLGDGRCTLDTTGG
jgi:hypothetical protein